MSTPLEQEQNEQLTIERVLRQLLPPQVILFANPRNHTLAMWGGTDSPQNVIEVLTANEWKVLFALAESYPCYSPYEVHASPCSQLSGAGRSCRRRTSTGHSGRNWDQCVM